MARKPTRSYIGAFRKLLLVALLFALVAVGGLFWFGGAGRQRERVPDPTETATAKGTILIGEDFDYTFTERERPIFRIRGESVRADAQNVVYLRGVGLTVYDEKGRPFHIESKQGRFSQSANEGLLEGDVFLKGPGGLELRTAKLDLKDKGHVIVTRGPVEIRYAEQYMVTAEKLRVELDTELYMLNGKVRLNSLPGAATPASLSSERLVYERVKRALRIEGNAELRRGEDLLKARRISADVTPDESGLSFVRAFWGVSGRTRASLATVGGEPGQSVVRFTGKDLSVILQPQGNQVRQVELEAQKKEKALIESVNGPLTRTLLAWRFEGVMEGGVLQTANAFGGVEMNEVLRGGPEGRKTRHAEGDRANAAFRPDGQLASMNLIGGVIYQDGQVRATGTRSSIDLEANRGEFLGVPVELTSERGTVRAPRVVYNTEGQVVTARGGVRAVLKQAADTNLAGTALGEGQGPVQVESQEAFWRQSPSSFLFRGDVRAWRGESLLLAPELRGDQEKEVLTATGGVKTLWKPEPAAAGGPKPAARRAAATGGTAGAAPAGGGEKKVPQSPIEVVAGEMVYQRGNGELTYTGNVRVEQEGRVLTCQRLEVELVKGGGEEGEGGKVETMTCSGDTKLNDPAGGRRIEGEKAVYRVADRKIEVTGNPVTMRDRDGNRVQGKRVLYSMDDGKVEVKGRDGTPAATPAPAATTPSPAAATPSSPPSGPGGTPP